MNAMPHKTRSAGFTLIELVTVMMIVGILAAIGIPSFKYVTTSNRIASEINGLLGDMQFARSEAVKQGLPVTVCSSNNGTSCTGGGNWQSGWIAFLDSNGDGVVNAGAGEQVIRVQPAFTSTDTFVPAAPNGTFAVITFNREGYAKTSAATNVTMLLHSAPAVSQWTRCLQITPVGMLSTQRAGTGNCT
jgi:type IV fimbrial biogenesis protein FimT